MEIRRVNTYRDSRFTQNVLNQHGCFLVDNIPCEIEITSGYEAVIRGAESSIYPALIDEFRFYTPHITCFYDEHHCVVREFPRLQLLKIKLEEIQPSQFYVDEDKIAAIGGFITKADDIIVQVLPYQDRYISLDGHTRLYYAAAKGWDSVWAVMESSDKWVYEFVEEAKKRNIKAPGDLILVSHEEYEEKWNHFCDDFFAKKDGEQ